MSEPEVPAARGLFKAWWVLSALFAVSAAAMAAKNLHANWDLHHKDAYFHAAGFADLAGALLSAAVAVVMFRAHRRRVNLGLALLAVAAVLTTLAVLAVAAGGVLSAHATSLCSCDGG